MEALTKVISHSCKSENDMIVRELEKPKSFPLLDSYHEILDTYYNPGTEVINENSKFLSNLENQLNIRCNLIRAQKAQIKLTHALLKDFREIMVDIFSVKYPGELMTIHITGSFSMNTEMRNKSIMDIIVFFNKLKPDVFINSCFNTISTKLHEAGNKRKLSYTCTVNNEHMLIYNTYSCISCHILSSKASTYETYKTYICTISHSEWFKPFRTCETLCSLIILLKDLRSYFVELRALNTWIITVLAFYCVFPHGQTYPPLGLSVSFMRFLKLISSGIFTPNSIGLEDPCLSKFTRIHSFLNLEEMDDICRCCQYIMNLISFGKYDSLFEKNQVIPESSYFTKIN